MFRYFLFSSSKNVNLILRHLKQEGSKMSSIIITPITYMNMKIVYLLNNTRRIYRMLVNADKAPLLTHTHIPSSHTYTCTKFHTWSYKNDVSRYVSRFKLYLIPKRLTQIARITLTSKILVSSFISLSIYLHTLIYIKIYTLLADNKISYSSRWVSS